MAILELEIADHIAVVRLNRPESRNALNPELIVRLAQAWDKIRADPEVRVVVLTGAQNSTFCAGFDLATFIPLMTGEREPEDEWDRTLTEAGVMELAGQATLRDTDLERPVVVAANGHAIAGGMEMLLAGDIRLVTPGARLGLSEVRLGLIPGMGGTARLARQIPSALAAEIVLTGNPISAERAFEAGLVNRVVAVEQIQDAALEYAKTLANNAPLAVRAARDVLRRSVDISETQALDLERARLEELSATEDAIEGPRSFREKRAPVFKGR